MSEDGAWVLGVEGILTEDETYHTLKVGAAIVAGNSSFVSPLGHDV